MQCNVKVQCHVNQASRATSMTLSQKVLDFHNYLQVAFDATQNTVTTAAERFIKL